MKAITIKKLVIDTGLPNRALREQEVRLYNAAKSGDYESIPIILNQGELNINSKHEFNWTPLHVATNRGHISVINILLNRKDLEPLSIDSTGKTALHLAANKRNTELVKILAPRIPIHIKDHSGETPLHIASKNNYADTIQFLLNAEADANALDHKGNTALHSAALNGRIISLECLLKAILTLTLLMQRTKPLLILQLIEDILSL